MALESTQQQQQQQPVEESHSPQSEVEDTGYQTLNRTSVYIDDGTDPFDPRTHDTKSEAEPETETEVTETPEAEVKPETEEEGKEEPTELSEEHQKFVTDLDVALKAKTGVDLAGITEALVELLTWRNDIIQLEQQQQQQEQVLPVPTPKIPQVQRSSGRNPTPAANAYDFRHSEILKMPKEEYNRKAQAITEAFINGRVLMDSK